MHTVEQDCEHSLHVFNSTQTGDAAAQSATLPPQHLRVATGYHRALSTSLRRLPSITFDPLSLQQQRSIDSTWLHRGLSSSHMLQQRRNPGQQHQQLQQTPTTNHSDTEHEAQISPLRPTARQANMAAPSPALTATGQASILVQDDNCDAEQQLRPWGPSSLDDHAGVIPSLIISPQQPMGVRVVWDPPAMSPVRHLLAHPPQDSSEYPADMELDESDADASPMLDAGVIESLLSRDFWRQFQPQQRQHPRQIRAHGQLAQQRPLQAFGLLRSFPQLQPPRSTGPRSRPTGSRHPARPPSVPTAWGAAPELPQHSGRDPAPANQQQLDAAYASAVQQVWARVPHGTSDSLLAAGRGDEQQPLLQSPAQWHRRQDEQHESVQQQQPVSQVPLCAEVCRPPAVCSFLRPGLSFIGSQRIVHRNSSLQDDQWAVRLELHSVDYEQGALSGSMYALDVAGAAGSIDTYWEGHIIDDRNNTFWTNTWGASRETDLRHWSEFDGFADIKPLVERHAGRCGQLHNHPWIFMRWKEQFFTTCKEQCGLTIAGFYYVALNRQTGSIRGLYFDPSSSPFQELELHVERSRPATNSSNTSSTQQGVGASSPRHEHSRMCEAPHAGRTKGVSFTSFSFA